jgi:hypothetical protein
MLVTLLVSHSFNLLAVTKREHALNIPLIDDPDAEEIEEYRWGVSVVELSVNKSHPKN